MQSSNATVASGRSISVVSIRSRARCTRRASGSRCDAIRRIDEVDGVRKAASQAATHRALDHRKLCGSCLDPDEQALDLVEELRCESWSLGIVPVGRCVNSSLRGRTQDAPSGHSRLARRRRSIASRASSHERPSSGFASCSARRSRMTSRCQFGTGTSSGRLVIRAQSDARYSSFSSPVRSSKPGGGSGTWFGMTCRAWVFAELPRQPGGAARCTRLAPARQSSGERSRTVSLDAPPPTLYLLPGIQSGGRP